MFVIPRTSLQRGSLYQGSKMDSDTKLTVLLLKMKTRCSDEHSIVNYGNPVSRSYVLVMVEKLYPSFVRCNCIDW